MENENDEDRPLTQLEQAAHFVAACGRSNVKLVTILRADLKRALGLEPQGEVLPASEATEYAVAKAGEGTGKWVSIIRSKLLAACRSIVAAATEPEESDGSDGKHA